ncbi:NAD-dependent epimerase/dehydratase family protein [Kitasatospora sp. NPDC052896]|uniref:NAD-dependent epimerase/dehydratase family protein n=1 Tax=Kitasatospora sp. NPDC052896 TaxID=3364061 RepID=UPI0037C7E3F7
MRLLVVGGTGFLGRHVVAELAGRGHQVAVLSRRPDAPAGEALTGDAQRLTEDDWAGLLHGRDGVVFAAGADDRTVPRAPAAAYFDAANVVPVRRLLAGARRAGCRTAVLHGSYFTAIARQRPEQALDRYHPYVRSRLAQARAARAAAGPELPVAVLEIPFVFGATPGRRPLWAPLVPWLRSPGPLFAPPGGTAAVTVRTVARATAEALERASGGDHPLADQNLRWAELLARFARAAGRRGPVRVHRLPPGLLHGTLCATGALHRLRGLEAGLAPGRLAGLLTSELYLDTGAFGLAPDDLDAALRETVAASLR